MANTFITNDTIDTDGDTMWFPWQHDNNITTWLYNVGDNRQGYVNNIITLTGTNQYMYLDHTYLERVIQMSK